MRIHSQDVRSLVVRCIWPVLAAILVLTTADGATAQRSDCMVTLHTSKGDIVIELYRDKAPKTTENFLEYVRSGHYDGTIFHRVIDGFMIQGGGMDAEMKERATREPVENEADNGVKNEAYTVAMARTQDPHSATSQFFINVADNQFLNHKSKSPQGWGYAAFGRVVEGQDVVDEIKQVPTGRKGFHDDVPTSPVIIESAEVTGEDSCE
ncbi:peptidyl-prolyl cis-trans isomerase [Oceanidesulfovibrio indonesiensis]|uniref:Peptidyl-prolyl cis-trans isomerase n=2 Tax=Oceanidesulfovibrio indonesiensis TaxID=54767 RepID=A0A7M3MB60_9BACT|nr:peptidyl-prolyl cis-trans isomerase [Oceanidesulfovibrio indonesiensis]